MILGLAPMDGITDLAYRLIVQDIFLHYNKNPKHQLRTRTEFMNADGYMITPHKLIRHMMHLSNRSGGPVPPSSHAPLIAQIYGGNEHTLIQTAIDLEKKYPDLDGIELNIGCPSPKVIACGGGSGMMKNKKKTLEIIKHMSENINIPFSIKVRPGLTETDKDEQFEFICETSQYCPLISIHGRTFKQGHSGPNDRDYIYKVKETLGDSTTIIGNGGITSHQDLLEKQGNLDGIMIGQFAIGNPWIFVDHEPTLAERQQRAIAHLQLACACEIYFKKHLQEPNDQELIKNRHYLHALKNYDENSDDASDLGELSPHGYIFPMPTQEDIEQIQANLDQEIAAQDFMIAPVEFRKYLFNYIKGIPGNKELKQKICSISKYTELQKAIEIFFAMAKS